MHSGTIAYCSRETPDNYPGFAAALARLAQRHPDAKIIQMVTNDIADGRNQAALQAEGEWLWFIDPDMLFDPSTLERLLAHTVDIVQVLCLKRHPPHEPLVWDTDDKLKTYITGPPRLLKVNCLGAGGTLYRKRVFETVQGPWFEGILGKEDTTFARKCVEAGFDLYVDLMTPVGHTTPMVIWPDYVNGAWHVRYDAMNGQQLLIPTLDKPRIVTDAKALALV